MSTTGPAGRRHWLLDPDTRLPIDKRDHALYLAEREWQAATTPQAKAEAEARMVALRDCRNTGAVIPITHGTISLMAWLRSHWRTPQQGAIVAACVDDQEQIERVAAAASAKVHGLRWPGPIDGPANVDQLCEQSGIQRVELLLLNASGRLMAYVLSGARETLRSTSWVYMPNTGHGHPDEQQGLRNVLSFFPDGWALASETHDQSPAVAEHGWLFARVGETAAPARCVH